MFKTLLWTIPAFTVASTLAVGNMAVAADFPGMNPPSEGLAKTNGDIPEPAPTGEATDERAGELVFDAERNCWVLSRSAAETPGSPDPAPDFPGMNPPSEGMATTNGDIPEPTPYEAFAGDGRECFAAADETRPDGAELSQALYAEFDRDNNGYLTIAEWDRGIDRTFGEADVNLQVSTWDSDGNGRISQNEFRRALVRSGLSEAVVD